MAKQEWTKAKKLAGQRNHAGAVDAYREAVSLDPKAQYKLDLARSLVEIGKLSLANETLAEIDETTEPNVKQIKSAAKLLIAKIQPRIPSVKVLVTGADALAVTASIDGEDVPIGEAVDRDPGDYFVRAEATGYKTTEEKITLAEGEKRVVNLALAPAPKIADTEDETESTGGGTMAPAGIAFGVGGAGLVLGTVFGILAFTETAALEEACGGSVCPPNQEDAIISAQTYGTVSTVGFIVGGAGVATGIILAFTVGSSDEPEAPKEESAVVIPFAGPMGRGGFGAGAVGTF